MALESSTEHAEAQADVQEDVNAAGSSPEETTDNDVETSVLDAVEKALKPEESSSDSESGTESEEADPKKAADGEQEDQPLPDLTDEEISAYPPNSQRRIRDLVGKYRDEETKVKDLSPKAEQYDRLIQYMDENRIQPSEVDNALNITRLINSGDFDGALEALRPIYQQLEQKAGTVLPEDLQEKVRLGYISEPDAQALHRNATKVQNTEARQAQEREQAEAEKRAQKWQGHVNSMVGAADQWAKSKAASDPDWTMKQTLVAEQVELEINRRGPDKYPQSEQEVIELSEAALQKVEAHLKTFARAPQERKANTGHSASPRSSTKPTNVMEAIDQALEASG